METLLKQAFQLRKQQKFEEAIAIYQKLWVEQAELFDAWAGWSYAFSLNKQNRYHEALEVCRVLYPKFKQFEMLNNLYGQCIYYTVFKAKPLPQIPILQKALNAMFQLSPPNHPYSYTALACFKMANTLMNQFQINWHEIEDWLNKIDPDLLSEESFEIIGEKGKQISLAGQKEEWYSLMIRVKGGLNKPNELLEILEAARKQNIKWHYNNDIWFARKEAFAYQQLGQREKAQKILQQITRKKRDWFLIFDLAQVTMDAQQQLKLMAEAALAPSKEAHKLKLYFKFYQLLKTEQNEIAKQHLFLWAALRLNNKWAIPIQEQEILQQLQFPFTTAPSIASLLQQVQPYWKNLMQDQKVEILEGRVLNILANQKSGFIRSGTKNYYFRTGKLEGHIQVGDLVHFQLMDSFDKRKNTTSQMAIQVRKINNK